ncbi:MAG: aminotransferase class I/II-fold pyridoxal phosphate-dependent enzyme [bacterium]|nr:aminotransferase class I/II-fold pyridoxal phosphate-dependent enzyme [bacterium]
MNLIKILKKKNSKLLFTTPSHSGKLFILHKFYNWYKADISEVDAYNPQKALFNAEKKASEIYGTKFTKFLTNGSTSGVIASVLTCAKNKKIMIWEKAHPCHKNAASLANCEIISYELDYNRSWGVYVPPKPSQIENLFSKNKPDAIIITSPTYEGLVADIRGIKQICDKHNVKLIVDEAHGALYPFCDKLPESAVKIADYTIQSLHKTAGGINPTALLHSNDLDPQEALKMINTTSPSYPMLMTIESNINYLNSKRGKRSIEDLIKNIETLRNELNNIEFFGDDITKILIKKEGLTGEELSSILYDKYNIEDERTNEVSTMLLCGLGTTKEKLNRLKKALKKF